MQNNLKQIAANQVAVQLLRNLIDYRENILEYLTKYLQLDSPAAKVWASWFNCHDDSEYHSEIAKHLVERKTECQRYIVQYLTRFLTKDKTTMLYWHMWFAGFDSNEIEVCEDALYKHVRQSALAKIA